MNAPTKVIVVDDNACMVWGLKHLIESDESGMVVAETVSRGCDALDAVRKHVPDVVLLEIALEEQSGLQLISLLNEGSAARVIVFTGLRDTALHEKAILAGARGLVLKSEPVEVVLRAIKAVHAGELWLKRNVTAKIVGMLSAAYHQSSIRVSNSMFTPSEARVIAAAVKYRGAPNKVVANVLHMSPNTFRNHLSTIYAKLGIHRRLDLVLYGIQNGAGEDADSTMDEAAEAGLRFAHSARPAAREAGQPVKSADGMARGTPSSDFAGIGPDKAAALRAARDSAAPESPMTAIDAYLSKRPVAAPPGGVPQGASVRLVRHLGPSGPTRIGRR